MKAELAQVVFDQLTTDTTLLALFGTTPRVSLRVPRRDEDYPWIVQKWDLKGSPTEDYPQRDGQLIFSVWDFNENAGRQIQIADRIEYLFEHAVFDLPAIGVKKVRLWYIDRTDVPTGDERYWREDVFFRVRLWNQQAAVAVLARP